MNIRVGYEKDVRVERDKRGNTRLRPEKRKKIFHARNIYAL